MLDELFRPNRDYKNAPDSVKKILDEYFFKTDKIDEILKLAKEKYPINFNPTDEIIKLNLPPNLLCPFAYIFTSSYLKKRTTHRHSTGSVTGIRLEPGGAYYTGYCNLCYCPGEYFFFGDWQHAGRSEDWEEFYKDCPTYKDQENTFLSKFGIL